MFGSDFSPLPNMPGGFNAASLNSLPQMAQPKSGMFGGGKVKIDLGRAFAGYLAGSGSQAGMQMLQSMDAQRQRQQEFAQQQFTASQNRQNDNADWKAHFDYTQANNPDAFDTNAIAGGYTPGTPEWIALHKQRADNEADPPVMTPMGMMLRSQALQMSGGQQAPQGVTFTPMDGGQTPPASGGFPR
jgi:hypothetical protein